MRIGIGYFAMAACLTSMVWAGAAAAMSDEKAAALGQVVAAWKIAKRCDGVKPIGNGDYQSFVMAATEITAAQGFGRQGMRALLFYGRADDNDNLGAFELDKRGLFNQDKALCRFGKKMAGTEDSIGRFLKGAK
ncbi:hypothetical protein [Cypionkella sinensis]|uniref:Uncharacterized protein n=1 Tax=Cypionkella sinensis TaxID=1756043 RepID=A0ABV7IYJ4_9RHOB